MFDSAPTFHKFFMLVITKNLENFLVWQILVSECCIDTGGPGSLYTFPYLHTNLNGRKRAPDSSFNPNHIIKVESILICQQSKKKQQQNKQTNKQNKTGRTKAI